MKYFRSNNFCQKGFTLVEMIVSIAIFTIVAVIAVGALLKIIDANKKAQSLKTTINNVHYLLDSMSREVRTGSRYYCSPSVPGVSAEGLLNPTSCNLSSHPAGGSWYVAFNSAKTYPKVGGGFCNLVMVYRFRFDLNRKVEAVFKSQQPNCENRTPGSWSDGYVIPSDVVISDLRLKVDTGVSIGQPRVFLRIKGYSGVKERNKTPFDVQTTISQRIDD